MSPSAVDPAELLIDLMALPPVLRAGRLGPFGVADDLLLRLGDEVERQAVSDPGAAMESAAAIVALTDEIGGPRSRARARRAHAQTLAYAGRAEDALACCQAAASIAEAAAEPVEAARARLASLHALASLGRFDDAIAAGQLAREVLAASGETGLAARADLNLGAVYAMREDAAAALACFERARPALVDEPAILAQLESNRGNALMALDRHEAAEAAFAEAVAAFERGGHPLAHAIAESNRAVLAARRGRLQDALARFELARQLLERNDAPAHLARTLSEQAETMVTLGLPGDAVAVFPQVLPELDRLGLKPEAARSRSALARALIALDRLDEAVEPLETAIAAFERLGNEVERARGLLLRAQLAHRQGDPLRARDTALQALAGLADRPVDRTLALAFVSRIALELGDLTAASASLAAAREIDDRLRIAPLTAQIATLTGRLRRARGEPALAAFRSAVEATERVRSTLQAARYRSAFHAERLEPYVELLVEALDARNGPDVELAFQAAELVKSRHLLDLVGGSFPASTGDGGSPAPELHARREAIRAEINWRYSRLSDSPEGDDGTAPRLPELERELDQLDARLAVLDPSPATTTSPVTIADALAAVEPGVALVSYLFARDELLAFVLGDGGCAVHRNLATRAQVEAAAQRFRFQIARAGARLHAGGLSPRLTADAQRELAALWMLLGAPLTAALDGAERLAIAPHDVLHTIPFAALWDGAAHLIDRAEIVVVPSLSLSAHLPPQADSGVPFCSLFGVADEAAPAIEEEVARIAAVLPEARVAVGDAATAERAIAELQSAGIVHLACHGRFLPDRPRASGVRLADRWLTLAEIAALRIPSSHVTLSACETGRASVRPGDELIGLTAGFYAAGARSTLYSLWPVDDATTAELMHDCYRRRAAGLPFAAALRAAQLALREHHPHPLHWASFVVGGRA